MTELCRRVGVGLVAVFFLSGLSAGRVNAEQKKQRVESLNIVSTIGMLSDITREIIGERIQSRADVKKSKVLNMMGEGIDPHTYRPTRGDIQNVMKADVVLYLGLYLEGQMAATFKRASLRGRKVYAIGEMLDKKVLISPDDFEGYPDPHVWGDVSLWSECVDHVVTALSEADPKHAGIYKSNAAIYKKKLIKLHTYARDAINSIPKQQRVLITAHDAFGYLGRAYGLKVMGIQGISTESEAGLSHINKLVDYLVKHKIKAVFVESSISDKNIKALIEGAKAQGHHVVIGGELFSDAMGPFGTKEGTYVGMVQHNVDTIVKALK